MMLISTLYYTYNNTLSLIIIVLAHRHPPPPPPQCGIGITFSVFKVYCPIYTVVDVFLRDRVFNIQIPSTFIF